jgi:deoxyribodipyrimidine photo-lyase
MDGGRETGRPLRTLLWYRGKDLRIADHAPLVQAAARGDVIPVFVLDPYFFAPQRAQKLPHRMQFLLEGLASLRENLRSRGSDLLLLEGRSVDVIPQLAAQWKVDRVVAHRWVEPLGRQRDALVQRALKVPLVLFEGETMLAPGLLRSASDNPFRVFGYFEKAWRARAETEGIPALPLASPSQLPSLPTNLNREGLAIRLEIPTLADLGIPHNQRLPSGGERAAQARLQVFVRTALPQYQRARDELVGTTSQLAADLKFGTLSARSVWNAVKHAASHPDTGADADPAAQAYCRQLIWREFAHSTLWDFPEFLQVPARSEWRNFPWKTDSAALSCWKLGKTGYPVVDAAARQLLAKGTVHNRARMIAASFLSKHLLISYQAGEAHYLQFLTDGDWAQNNFNWQWVAGCGFDAQPYFRIFNPTTQGKRFDANGDYVRTWLPELAKLPTQYLHEPWSAPPEVLRNAGISLGSTYPTPIIEHAAARARYLSVAKAHLKEKASTEDAEP